MAEEIHLFKADGQEWGFRVTGGADFGTPLTIIKINKGSTGERAGLRVGDMIVQVNDQPLGHMMHFEATDAISKAGNTCKVTVIRGSLVTVPQVPKIVVPNVTENGEPITNHETNPQGEHEELVLPSLLANLINSGIQDQVVDEDISANQKDNETDKEVSDTWNFSLPQHLVVTLKSVTPIPSDGRPTSPWEIIEERNTFVDQTGKLADAEPKTGKKATPTEGKQKSVAAVEGATTRKQKQSNGVQEGKETHALPVGQNTQGESTKGEQKKSDVVENSHEAKTEGQTAGEETAEEHKEYTEEEIAEMMSGCAEVLVGKCIGVDFQKLPPDTDIMKSEVLHLLIDEKIHKPEKKLTTFQQRPSRPKQKPKGEPATPRTPYYPLKYKGTPKKKEEEVVNLEAAPASEAIEGAPCLEERAEGAQETVEGEQTEGHMENMEETTEHENVENTDQAENPTETQEVSEPIVVDSSDIESQLVEIQNQLAAIIQLPVEIQQHLSFIQTQLSKIVQLRAAETTENHEAAEEEPTLEGEEHHDEVPAENEEQEETEEHIAEGEGDGEMNGEGEEQVTEEPELEPEPEPVPEPEPEPPKHKKDIDWKKEEEAQKRNKPFFPLTPQPRPVQLPGGRHWFKPRDVYTDDFIAETISGKEEIITGTTIGVDFRKFQCNLEHLKSSSVYKMIHSDENKREPGVFANRAEVVRCKEDYVNPYKPTETTFSFYKTKNILGS